MINNYEILKSGSEGNCIILRDIIALDMGVPFSTVKPYLKQLKIVFITHEHSDHLKKSTIKKLAFEKPSLAFCVGKHLVKHLINCGVNPKKIYVLEPNRKFDLGAIIVEPFELTHDVPNFGFKIIFKKDNYKTIYATDTSNMNNVEALDYDLYLVECDYNQEELEQRILDKQQNNEYIYEFRAANTHLSEGQWADFMLNNANGNSECVKIHQHNG